MASPHRATLDYPPDVLERLEQRFTVNRSNIWRRQRRIAGIEDYLFIGGDRMSARDAAGRLGVTERTITRWRAELKAVTP